MYHSPRVTDCSESQLPTHLACLSSLDLRYVLKPGARIVIFVLRGLQVTRIVRKLGGRYRLLRVQVIRTSNNLPSIVVLEKLGRDELNNAIKSQLSYLSQYVNISRELYHDIHMEKIDMDDDMNGDGGASA